MPRPRQSQGRPDTRVIPKNWESEHGKVASRTHNATVQIYTASEDNSAGSLNEDLTRTSSTPPELVYTGPARIQVQNAQQKSAEVGDQSQITLDYLVALDRDVAGADDVTVRSVIKVIESPDPSLVGALRLYVAQVERGSVRFERDLICVDDITRLP